jgi:hypothetical protein
MQAQRETVGLNTGARGQLRGKDVSGGFLKNPPEDDHPTLAESGIDKNLAHRARAAAKMTDAKWRASNVRRHQDGKQNSR